jgi:hypothetical protein
VTGLADSTHGCWNRPGRYRVSVCSEDGEVFASMLVDALGPERAVGIASDTVRWLGWVDVVGEVAPVSPCPPGRSSGPDPAVQAGTGTLDLEVGAGTVRSEGHPVLGPGDVKEQGDG